MDRFRDDEHREIDKPKSSMMLNRSMTLRNAANPIEFPEKPVYFYPSPPPIKRNGSVKKLHTSPLESTGTSFKGTVKNLCSLFESRKPSNLQPQSPTKPAKSFNSDSRVSSFSDLGFRLPGTKDSVVIYFTSLRGIRRTFEDCYTARMILKSYQVKIDERDISMDSAFKKELQNVLDQKNVNLPQVFIKGKYIGGSEVIKQLNEMGELSKLLRGLPLRPPGYMCEGCGDMRFLPCSHCDGSRKYFDEDEGQLRRCPDCNENGLVRCPLCCS
ncbi:putative G-type lectin S-receptor-like serine/threonine-protein kinase RLK1-like [Capsicum annuum]|uniref:Glutaredoxin domain-containing protein n=1 Tax=Capsicum annuum TaxID=4072 RepID=A0A1U8G8P7_CAPAN|nr:uncharacterized protein At5g39865 [Capsicum annuum]KAF3649199.1 putative G-type lectin S-receptor-like serine/threonine-protein kinase RLK1-like [Capsicum annuum]KAF3675348.1 putative G-type lectin S-receptor-like serine/threonine-protein kinase RLK1-like [Capsicum annuum]PHT86448.1 hypothetical protein T459_08554 [Capsicum annuum]